MDQRPFGYPKSEMLTEECLEHLADMILADLSVAPTPEKRRFGFGRRSSVVPVVPRPKRQWVAETFSQAKLAIATHVFYKYGEDTGNSKSVQEYVKRHLNE